MQFHSARGRQWSLLLKFRIKQDLADWQRLLKSDRLLLQLSDFKEHTHDHHFAGANLSSIR